MGLRVSSDYPATGQDRRLRLPGVGRDRRLRLPGVGRDRRLRDFSVTGRDRSLRLFGDGTGQQYDSSRNLTGQCRVNTWTIGFELLRQPGDGIFTVQGRISVSGTR